MTPISSRFPGPAGYPVIGCILSACTPLMQPAEEQIHGASVPQENAATLRFAFAQGGAIPHEQPSGASGTGTVDLHGKSIRIPPPTPPPRRKQASWMVLLRDIIERDTPLQPELVEGVSRMYPNPVGTPISLKGERLLEVPILILYVHTLQGDDWKHLVRYLRDGGFFIGIFSGDMKDVEDALQEYSSLQQGKDFRSESLPDDHPIFGVFYNLKEALPKVGLKDDEDRALMGLFIQDRLSGVFLTRKQFTEMFNLVIRRGLGHRLGTPRCQMLINVMVYAMYQKKTSFALTHPVPISIHLAPQAEPAAAAIPQFFLDTVKAPSFLTFCRWWFTHTRRLRPSW